MKSQTPKYCEHFQYLKINESLFVDKEVSCKYCFHGPLNLWICLSKGCMIYVCAKNNFEHLQSHLQESRKHKKFHSIFMNIATTEIKCIQCMIQIEDLDTPSNKGLKSKQDPFPYRLKLLPGLADLTTQKIIGQLENSEGHRKISRGLVGIFSNKYNHTIATAVQFVTHSKFIKELILNIKISQKNKILQALADVVKMIDEASYRAIHLDALCQLLYREMPELYGYKRKDPFDIILYLFNLVNDEVIYYSINSNVDLDDVDQWDMFYKKNTLNSNHIIYNAIQSTLSLNYMCAKCQLPSSVPHNIQFLKLNIPKKKRKTKEIQKELANHRISSPMKTRRKSLVNFFKEQQCPLTIPQLIIDLMKSPLHKQMVCQLCYQPLKKTRIHFGKLPDILIIQISRISKEGNNVDQSLIELSTESLDLGPFSDNTQQEILYDFQSAVCIQKGCLFPIVLIGQSNKQLYVIKNEVVQLCKQKMNPYILCYKKRPSETARQKLTMIQDDLKDQRKKDYSLPDFWYLQLLHGIERPFKNQFICKHNAVKPHIQSKMRQIIYVSADVYEDLSHFYKARRQTYKAHSPHSPNSPNPHFNNSTTRKNSSMYISPRKEQKLHVSNEVCQICSQEVHMINQRRKKQKQFVLFYDKLRAESLPYCMISGPWIKKWSNFLYNNDKFAYMPKGYPLPPFIDNKLLLDGNKCKVNLVKNEDYKILNIYLWKFLKEVYGGGPEIRYKWKQGRENLDEEMIAGIKSRAYQLKEIYSTSCESPKKLTTSLSFIERSSFIQNSESFVDPSFQPYPQQTIQQQQP